MWGIVAFLRPCLKWLRDEFSTGPQSREDLLKTITLNTGPFILKISPMFYFFSLTRLPGTRCVRMLSALCQIVVTFIILTFKIFFVVVHPWFLQTGHLAMETLLSLTSKRAGDWFKEELRLLGGLDHIVDKGWLYWDVFRHGASCRVFWPSGFASPQWRSVLKTWTRRRTRRSWCRLYGGPRGVCECWRA